VQQLFWLHQQIVATRLSAILPDRGEDAASRPVLKGFLAHLALLSLAGPLACAARPGEGVAAAVEIDHVYLYAPARSVEDAVVKALASAGLGLQPQRNDFGDGVVGRYVEFENTYLELLWYDGKTAADPDTLRRATWESSGASPFGIGLRRRAGVPEELPFPTRSFAAPWLRPGTEYRVLGAAGDHAAPDLFVVPAYAASRRPGSQPLGMRRLTDVRMTVVPAGMTEGVELINQGRIAVIESGRAPALVLTFDGGQRTQSLDFRPLLPLTLVY
jgi:hypothetical protein